MRSVTVYVRLFDAKDTAKPPKTHALLDYMADDEAVVADVLHVLLTELELTIEIVRLRSINVRSHGADLWQSVLLADLVADGSTYEFTLAVTATRTTQTDTQHRSKKVVTDCFVEEAYDAASAKKTWKKRIIKAGNKLLNTGLEFAAYMNGCAYPTTDKAVRIVEINSAEYVQNRFSPNYAALEHVLFRDSRAHGLPVSVVTVAGAYRSGKSFLLNFFLRYLQHLVAVNAGTAFIHTDWFQPTEADNERKHYDFKWKPGREGVTKGIQVWPHPFILRRADGTEFAVVLMDTQGTEDLRSRDEDCIHVFAMSTMISSCQVYSVPYSNINKLTLQRLQQFVPRSSKKALEAGLHESQRAELFQDMVFLVRDAPDDYGFESGGQTVDMLLKNGLVDNAHEGAEIASCFDAVRGFNMPYPGEEIARGFRGTEVTYRALFEGMNLNFKAHIKSFTETLLDPERIPLKTINGKVLTCAGLLCYFKANMRLTNANAVERAKDDYLSRMFQQFEDADNLPPFKASALNQFHASALAQARQVFDEESIGGALSKTQYHEQLDCLIVNEYKAFQKRNVEHAVPLALDVYIQKLDSVICKNEKNRSFCYYAKEHLDSIHQDSEGDAKEHFKKFADGFKHHSVMDTNFWAAFRKRKIKNAVNYYMHTMTSEKNKCLSWTAWTNQSLDDCHKQVFFNAMTLAALDATDDDEKASCWDLEQTLKMCKAKFIPPNMPRGNGIAHDAALAYYMEELRKSIILYETPYVEETEFVDITDNARTTALRIFESRSAEDHATPAYLESLKKEIKQERTRFEKINRKNLLIQYLRRAGAFFGGLVSVLVPWIRTGAPPSAPVVVRMDRHPPSGLWEIAEASAPLTTPIITEVP